MAQWALPYSPFQAPANQSAFVEDGLRLEAQNMFSQAWQKADAEVDALDPNSRQFPEQAALIFLRNRPTNNPYAAAEYDKYQKPFMSEVYNVWPMKEVFPQRGDGTGGLSLAPTGADFPNMGADAASQIGDVAPTAASMTTDQGYGAPFPLGNAPPAEAAVPAAQDSHGAPFPLGLPPSEQPDDHGAPFPLGKQHSNAPSPGMSMKPLTAEMPAEAPVAQAEPQLFQDPAAFYPSVHAARRFQAAYDPVAFTEGISGAGEGEWTSIGGGKILHTRTGEIQQHSSNLQVNGNILWDMDRGVPVGDMREMKFEGGPTTGWLVRTPDGQIAGTLPAIAQEYGMASTPGGGQFLYSKTQGPRQAGGGGGGGGGGGLRQITPNYKTETNIDGTLFNGYQEKFDDASPTGKGVTLRDVKSLINIDREIESVINSFEGAKSPGEQLYALRYLKNLVPVMLSTHALPDEARSVPQWLTEEIARNEGDVITRTVRNIYEWGFGKKTLDWMKTAQDTARRLARTKGSHLMPDYKMTVNQILKEAPADANLYTGNEDAIYTGYDLRDALDYLGLPEREGFVPSQEANRRAFQSQVEAPAQVTAEEVAKVLGNRADAAAEAPKKDNWPVPTDAIDRSGNTVRVLVKPN